MNDGGEEASGTLMMNNEVFDETRYFFYSVFRFVQRNKKNISVIKKKDTNNTTNRGGSHQR